MPLKQFSSALVLAALLAGCSSNGDGPSTEGASVATGSASAAPAATPVADGRCDANAVQAYVGKQASAAIVEEARRAAGAEVARALRPHDAVTMDYNPRRLNIDVDDTLVIKRLSCG
ncbi:I78 family peptidase inhibitor [Pseudomonas aeruginosa]|uniref:I78 family peptidase inhibitor n=1 Tax=Pseudomonas aeruginosa TaxID=287 RepID=UPI002236219E|nr:I78 family peptidase inhibitor [Pseudomonas aeruginosa]